MTISPIEKTRRCVHTKTLEKNIRNGKKAAHLSVLTVALATFLSGCVVESSTPQTEDGFNSPPAGEAPYPSGIEEPESSSALAKTITTSTDMGSKLQIELRALERLENSLLRLSLSVANNSSERVSLGLSLAEDGDQNTASSITLIDAENQKRYLSYDQSDGRCFCSQPLQEPIGPGETADMWVIYPEPPPEIERMTVVIPLAPPLLDVPISASGESVKNEGISEAEILDLTIISDNLDDQTGRTENNEEVSIILSSDILFETNSAELSADAEEILKQVAQEINDASSPVVEIDGYADNTGSESINIPLSENRASAVEGMLSDLVRRDEVIFNVRGHGSNDPIADNSTDEGRERNRRVSVTFEK